MRRMITGMQMTLDGMIEAPDGAVDFVSSWEEDYGMPGEADLCLLGSGMYPTYERYWQTIIDAPDQPLADVGRPPLADEVAYARWAVRTPHVVLSRTMESALWPQTRFARSIEEVAALRQGEGGAIYVVGGAQTVAALTDADLIDEWRFILHPVALGAGKPLFATLAQRQGFALVDSRAQSDGSVRLTYRRGGGLSARR